MRKYLIIKRTLDLTLSILLLPVAIPLIIIFSIIITIKLKEFPLYFQRRGLTLNRYVFTIVKLKTIKTNATTETIKKDSSNILLKPILSRGMCPFAAWLRKTGLDEIPQIFNILLGQMSFIGPRPLMMSDLQTMKNDYLEHYKQRQKLDVKPGLSGMWQLFCKREEGIKNLIALDTIYDELKSVALDFKLILFTIPIVFTGTNTDAIVTKDNFPLKGLFGLTNTTQFVIAQPNKSSRKIKFQSPYKVNIPGDWWTASYSFKSSRTGSVKILRRSEIFRKAV